MLANKRIAIILCLVIIIAVVAMAWMLRLFPWQRQNILPHQMHSQLTGIGALNDTTIVDVNGTDLGIIVKHSGIYHYIFGDTFGVGDFMTTNWRSNTMAYSEDTNPSDGIMLKGWIHNPPSSNAKELISSLKIDNAEMTCIPTTAVSFGGNLYIYYMSVKHWHVAGGRWDCNNASIAVSTDDGQTFTKISNISWPGDSNFIQFGIVQDPRLYPIGSPLYLLATPSGRFGACYLCRMYPSEILNQSAYDYYSGQNESGSPTWSSDHTKAVKIISAPVGELSVMWNTYLQKWTVFYTKYAEIQMRTAENLWGKWSPPYTVVSASEYPSLYGSFVHPDLVEANGQTIYFVMSLFNVYNTFIMSVDLSALKDTTIVSSNQVHHINWALIPVQRE